MAWFAFYVLRGQGSSSGGDAGAGAKSRYGHLGALGPSLTGSMRKAKPYTFKPRYCQALDIVDLTATSSSRTFFCLQNV